MDRDKLKETLAQAEGVIQYVYDDITGKRLYRGDIIKGNMTIGVGHNLQLPLSNNVINFILEEDINEAIRSLDRHISWWYSLDDVRARALIELTFNMGIGKLLTFHNMIEHLKLGDYKQAASHLLSSLWADQVGTTRSTRIAYMIREGLDWRSV